MATTQQVRAAKKNVKKAQAASRSSRSIANMGGVVLGILVWQEGGGSVGALIGVGVLALVGLAFWLRSRKRNGKPTLIDPGLFSSKLFTTGVSQQMLQQITLGGAMISLPIFLQMVLEYNALEAGLSMAPLSLSMRSLYWRTKACQRGSLGGSASLLAPYFFRRSTTSVVVRPTSGLTSSSRQTSSAVSEYQLIWSRTAGVGSTVVVMLTPHEGAGRCRMRCLEDPLHTGGRAPPVYGWGWGGQTTHP